MANEVRVLVKSDTRDARRDIDGFKDSVGGGIAGAARVASAALAGIGVAGVAGLGLSISTAANFEQALDQVGAVAGATKAEMDGLSDTALRIGKDTAFSATEAAGAMEMLAANGVSVTEIMDGAADAAVALAAAGGTDLATAADTASTAMAVWGINARDMADVVNRLAGAANVSRFGVEDMAGAIAQGGGAAKTAGVEFADFAAAVAAIAPSFSSGSDAGTSMKTFLANLVPDTNKAKDAFKALGITTADGANRFFDASGKLKSMAEIASILHEVTSGLSEEQKTLALNTMFGSDAMRTAAALADLTGDEFQALQDTMGQTDAADIAAQRMGNFKGSLEQLKGSLEVIQIEIGQRFLPVLTELATWAAEKLPVAFDYIEKDVAPKVAAAFDAMKGPAQAFVEDLREQFDAFMAYYDSDLRPAFNNIGAALSAGFEVASDVLTRLQPVFMAVGNVVRDVANIIKLELGIIVDLLGGDFTGAWTKVKDVLKVEVDLWKDVLNAGIEAMKAGVGLMVDLGAALLGGLKEGADAVWEDAVKPFLVGLPGNIVAAIGDLGATLFDLGKSLLGGMLGGIEAFWDDPIGVRAYVVAIPGEIVSSIGDVSTLLLDVGKAIAKSLLDGLVEGAKDVWEEVKSWGGKIKDLKGPMDVDRQLLVPEGEAIANSLGVGLDNGFKAVVVPMVSAWGGVIADTLYANVPDYVKAYSPAAGGKLDFSSPGDYKQSYIGGGQYGYEPILPKVGDWMGQGQAAVQWDGQKWIQGGLVNSSTFYPGMYDRPADGTMLQPVIVQFVTPDMKVLAEGVIEEMGRSM